jgi:hypothetical protein
MTKPTRLQEQACEKFAQALLLIADGARQDGKSALSVEAFRDIATRVAHASSAFGVDQIVARGLEMRARALGMRSGTGELLTLLEGEISPLALLYVPDEAFREQVAAMENELGEA